MTEVMANLVDNAIEYSKGRQVRVTADVDGNYVRCSIYDTGIGIRARSWVDCSLNFIDHTVHAPQ